MSANQTYFVRWKGTTSGPFDQQTLKRMLEVGEISLNHEVRKDQQWMTVEDFASELSLLRPAAPVRKKPDPVPAPPKVETKPAPSGEVPASEGPKFPGLGTMPTNVVAPRQASAGPPPMSSSDLHINKDGQTLGPYSVAQVKQMVDGGLLSPSDQAWREGLAAWVPISALVASIPPPPQKYTGVSRMHQPSRPNAAARPESVAVGIRLLYAGLALQAFGICFALLQGVQGMSPGDRGMFTMIAGLTAVLIIGLGWLFIQQASEGKNWARVVLLVFAVLTMVGEIARLAALAAIPKGVEGFQVGIGWGVFILGISGVIALFRAESSHWYTLRKAQRYASILAQNNLT